MSITDDVDRGVVVLAAVDRGERHRVRDRRWVPVGAIAEHLALEPRSAGYRRMRQSLDALTAAGLLERVPQRHKQAWALTSVGRRRLSRARSAGKLPVLPEAPQHVAWRRAREQAQARIAGFGTAVADALQDASFLLDDMRDGRPAGSDEWFAIAERLRRACWTVGSASYCLYEWREPEDDRADIDSRSEPGDEQLPAGERNRRRARRAGRRNTTLWQTPPSRTGGAR